MLVTDSELDPAPREVLGCRLTSPSARGELRCLTGGSAPRGLAGPRVVATPTISRPGGRSVAVIVAPRAGIPRRALVDGGSRLAEQSRYRVVEGYVSAQVHERVGSSYWSWIERRRIAFWAAARGWRLAGMLEEERIGGSVGGRTVLDAALERVESGETDGLVVARLSHVGASLDEALRAIERVQAAGGTFVSVCDHIDLSTANGRQIVRILSAVADW